MFDKIKNSIYGHLKRLYDFLYNFYYDFSENIFNMVVLEVTTRCNRECPYCPHFWKDNIIQEEIKEKTVEKLAKDLKSVGFDGTISLAGEGEPLLHTNIRGIVKILNDELPQSHIKIVTNGDFLSVGRFKSLLKAGVDRFSVSEHLVYNGGEYKKNSPKK